MYLERIVLDLTVNSSGAATVYSPYILAGRVLQIAYVPDGSTPLDTNADLTLTGESSGTAIATLSNIGTSAFTKCPRQPTHGITGTALVYAGTDGVNVPVCIAGERIKVVVAQGGVSKIGTLHLFIG